MANILNNTASLREALEALQNKAAGGEQATPVIDINSSTGLITATAGTKSATRQLAFQAAKTITPGTTNQTAVAANTYVGGAITVKGDSNLVAGNIKKGTSIFGVAGNYEGNGSGGGDTSIEDALIDGTITTYTNSRVKKLKDRAFYECIRLTSVSFPNCSYIGDYAFYSCSSLTSVSFPACSFIGTGAFFYCSSLISVNFSNCSYIGINAFYDCSSLTSVNFSNCSYIGTGAFEYCSRLTSVSFPICSYIGSNAFYDCSSLTLADFGTSTFTSCRIYSSAFNRCSKLTTLILRYGSVITLSNVNAFASTPMSVSTLTGAFGSIYVPASLVAAYKSATNWAKYADRITAIVEKTMITFTINDVSYQAEEGMTWGEWVDSEYNTGGFKIASNAIMSKDNLFVNQGKEHLEKEYIIINNTSYTISAAGFEEW